MGTKLALEIYNRIDQFTADYYSRIEWIKALKSNENHLSLGLKDILFLIKSLFLSGSRSVATEVSRPHD